MARRCERCWYEDPPSPRWVGWVLGVGVVVGGFLLVIALVVASRFYERAVTAISRADAWEKIARGWQAVVSYDDALSHGTKRPSRLLTLKKPPAEGEK